MRKLKCLFVSTEVAPYVKTGGLGDVAGALPKELMKNNVDVRIAMPYYQTIKGKFFEEQFITSYDVHLGWRKQEVDLYYNEDIVPTYLLKNNYYFGRYNLYGYHDDYERFAFFCKGVLEMIRHIDFVPDIIHCNDWQTGPICLLLTDKYSHDTLYSQIKTVYSIHNLKYQGIFGREALEVLELDEGYMNINKLEFNGGVSFMKAGLLYADKINTVSPTYAEEIKTWKYGCGLDGLLRGSLSHKLVGILNGIDYDVYNPMTDKYLYTHYNIDTLHLKKENKRKFQEEYGLEQKDCMMIGVISRITDQKGFDLMKHTIEGKWMLDKVMDLDVQFVLLGTGEYEYENMFKHFKYAYGDRVGIFLTFNEALAQKIYGACDVFLMPSEFEPCGLGQLMAMRYGTVPIVRQTGGLKDTVLHYNEKTKEGTGFEFEDYSGYWLYKKIEEAYQYYTNKPEDFKHIQQNGMQAVHSWNESSKEYKSLYIHLKG